MLEAKTRWIWVIMSVFLATPAFADNDDDSGADEPTVAELQASMAAGRLTSEQLTRRYIRRIEKNDRNGAGLNSVIELNPDAIEMARHADRLRAQGRVLGPLHGIPVLLKDNIDTGDRMQTSAGSLALVGAPALQDSTVAANLRAGGAVILGKTNLSEWANFRSSFSTSGWSGRGGQTHNPYSIDRNPCGSSSGSAAAVSAKFTTVSLGSETDGSIVCPGNASGVVAIKPTVGLTSRAGVVPISHTQDTIGPHGRTVADAATVLGVIQSVSFDGRDAATGSAPLGWKGLGRTRPTNIPPDYTVFLDPNGLQGARIGITRQGLSSAVPQVQAAFDQATSALAAAGATIVDLDAASFTFPAGSGEFLILVFDFKLDVQSYFGTRVGVPVAQGTLADAIAFNNAHADVEMPFFGQDVFELAQSIDTSSPDAPQPAFNGMTYNQALAIDQSAGNNGIDLALSTFQLDAVVAPTGGPAWTTDLINSDHFAFGTSNLAAIVGYPIVQVPSANVLGIPVGISFFGTAFSEPTLIRLASGFEAATHARIVPTLAPSLPNEHLRGVRVASPRRAAQALSAPRDPRMPAGL
jgi:amidase